jgi:hypothetical protein
MPTQITSAGITFNDATTLTTANLPIADGAVTQTKIADNAVTAVKLGTNEQKQIAKAWVNFNGTTILTSQTAANAVNLSVISGSNTGTWSSSTAFDTSWNGQIFFINSIAGVSGATFGGLNVATVGFQVTSVSGTSATVRFLAGNATSSQTITGTGSSSTGYVYSTSGIRSSYNVSSVTKNGTGDYTVNFATAMADANYAMVITTAQALVTGYTGATYTVNAARLDTRQANTSTLVDPSIVSVQVFGN